MKRVDTPLTLDNLPMFATDREIAEAVVGKHAAEKWLRERLPTLAKTPGFPAIDEFHGGRAVLLVKRFYQNYLGLPAKQQQGKPDGPEDDSGWTRRRRA